MTRRHLDRSDDDVILIPALDHDAETALIDDMRATRGAAELHHDHYDLAVSVARRLHARDISVSDIAHLLDLTEHRVRLLG